MATRFEPGGYLSFDLRAGQVKTRAGERVVILPDRALEAWLASPAGVDAMRSLGQSLAKEVRLSLGREAASTSPEDVAHHAGAALALLGLGSLALETWGDALAVTVRGAPPSMSRAALGALLDGLIGELAGAAVSCASLGGDRFAIVSPQTAATVGQWVAAGQDAAAVIARLGGAS